MEFELPRRTRKQEVFNMMTVGKKPGAGALDVDNELRKIQAHIQVVSNKLSNSELELGASVRLNVRRRELNAYLQGILFALGQAPPLETSVEPER